jgi:hypothetical protein
MDRLILLSDAVEECIFCRRSGVKMSDEHVIPKWIRDRLQRTRRAFDPNASQRLSVYSASSPGVPAQTPVDEMDALNIRLKRKVCRDCNTGFLSRLENQVAEVLGPMMFEAAAVKLDREMQQSIAVWATKTILLLELAVRQKYPEVRPIDGYAPSDPELAWLYKCQTPIPRSIVWISCWDCKMETPFMFEPAFAKLPTPAGNFVDAHITSFAVGFVSFQLVSTDFVVAEQLGASHWVGVIPAKLINAIVRLWPDDRVVLDWPTLAFANEEWHRFVTWDGHLRPLNEGGVHHGP